MKEHPRSSWGWYALGYSLFAQQKIGDSIKSLAKSLELDVTNAEAHKILGRNLMIIGRFDAAQVEFEQALRYKPDSAEIYYNLGKLFSIQDNWEPARKQFEAALRIDPSYLEALDALGFALEALGDDAGALAAYQKAIALNEERKGTFASPLVNMSAYYNRTDDPAKGARVCRPGARARSASDRAWFQKGRASSVRGKLDEAAKALNRAISINPRASSYYYVLAGVFRRLGLMDESQKALERSSVSSGKPASSRKSGATAERRSGDQPGSPRRFLTMRRRLPRRIAGGGHGSLGVPLSRHGSSRLVRGLSRPTRPGPVIFTDVTAKAGLARALNVSGSSPRASGSCSKRWEAAPPSSTTTTTGGSTSSS